MRRNSNRSRRGAGLLLAVLLAAVTGAAAAEPENALFGATEPLTLRLEAPFQRVARAWRDPQYEAARLSYAAADGQETTHDLRVRVRGKSRAELCSFPPLLLNFPNEGLEGSLFEGQNRLKLVTHCQASSDYEQHLLLEYLAYRSLALVTDLTLRARLVQISYFDSARGREVAMKPGILLEDEELFGERMGLAALALPAVERGRYDQPALALLEVFQYFLGNTDWSAVAGPNGAQCCHNVVPYARADGMLFAVPYDFDSAGIVNAPHALPNERLPIRNVRQRLYRGPCRAPAELAAAFDRFAAVRAELTGLFQMQPGLDARTRAVARDYANAFYTTLETPELVERAFRADC
jgi:hypothetical protein